MVRWLTLLCLLAAGCSSSPRHALDNREYAGVSNESSAPAGEAVPLTLEENRQAGERLLLAGRYAEALPYFERASSMTIDPHDEFYNIACCHARLGRRQEAVEFLWRAFDTGVNQYPFVSADADLATLKGFAPYEEFMATLKRRYDALEKSAGTALLVEGPALHEVRVRLPENFDKARHYPLVIGLHEYGGNAAAFAGLYDSISYKSDFIFAAVNGPCPVPAGDENPGGRWWWLHGAPDDGWMRSRAAMVQTVLNIRTRLCAEFSVDERNIYLLGYRQGGTAAMLICSTEWKQFAGFVAIGSHHLGDSPVLQPGFSVLLCHARNDEKLDFSACDEARAIWSDGGAEVTIEELIDGSTIGADATSAITAWLQAEIEERNGE